MLRSFFALVLIVGSLAPCKGAAHTEPNLIVILADDLGWNDLSIHGGKAPTPNIDRLAASGMQFKNLVVNSLCSPTRASFYTGCDAIRSRFAGEVGDRMNPALPTIAKTFRAAGYRTGLFGKWHNGHSNSKSPWSVSPMQAGFETFEGFYGGGTDYYDQTTKGPRNWYRNEQQIADGSGYTTDLITEGVLKFIEHNKEKPFFCMVAQAAPHEPFQATDALLRRVPASIAGELQLTGAIVRERARQFAKSHRMDAQTGEYGGFTEAERQVIYSAMLIGLDDSVGRILEALKAAGQDQNTIILFFSDNGAMQFIREGNLPFRGSKHNLYEGGIHVPGFISYASQVAPGSSYEPLVRSYDLFPTLAAMAGVSVPGELDGVNHLPAMLGKAKAPELDWNGVFVYYGAYRTDRWKLIAKAGANELYDLKADPSESRDVASAHPEVVTELRAKHEAWMDKHKANLNYRLAAPVTPSKAEPQGEVLQVTFNAGEKRAKQVLTFPLRRVPLGEYLSDPGDCLVYDMKIESMRPGQTAFISYLRSDSAVYDAPAGGGMDAEGKLVNSLQQLPGPLNQWKRYVLGMGNLAGAGLCDMRLIINSTVPGEIRVQLDNVHILKPNGFTIGLWNGGAAPADPGQLQVQTVPLTNPSAK